MNQRYIFTIVLIYCSSFILTEAQHSVARNWNEVMLSAIRRDFARPVVQAHNLFHFSVAVYDAWAVYDQTAETYLLGKSAGSFTCPFNGISAPADINAARREAISYAAYRLLRHRYQFSPGKEDALRRFNSLMKGLGYDTTFTSTDYSTGSPAALGNYIGQALIDLGKQDGCNEEYDYGNLFYLPVNTPLDPTKPGNPDISDPNRWQPLSGTFIDQNGNPLPITTQKFLGAEWGGVTPCALTEADMETFMRDNFNYKVFHDPGTPPFMDTLNPFNEASEMYRWTFTLVAVWASHLNPDDGVMWDVSPQSIGNVQDRPETWEDLINFYDLENGGDPGTGYTINPRTNQPYQQQIVPRGDYTRVLAEFWADGPSSETPPGHWYSVLNYVNDHPAFEKRFKGTGPVLNDLEWDVKAYFALGGAVHDAAVAAWGIKGWYDYVRPVSAIRWMADKGQCSDPGLPHYSPLGLRLMPGLIELVEEGDTLSGENGEHLGKIKLFTWKAHEHITDPLTSYAGAGWILAENWWPYQRPTFVTPPFAGYISGHSTFSRSAAELLTLLTGDEYFPGGMGEFYAEKNNYLVFEDGPSMDVKLQWATYRDASDQCSLSRIWGGIHPPVDDIPGRLIGKKIGPAAFNLAEKYFNGQATGVEQDYAVSQSSPVVNTYPNPVQKGRILNVTLGNTSAELDLKLYNILGEELYPQKIYNVKQEQAFAINMNSLPVGFYVLRVLGNHIDVSKKVLFVK